MEPKQGLYMHLLLLVPFFHFFLLNFTKKIDSEAMIWTHNPKNQVKWNLYSNEQGRVQKEQGRKYANFWE